MNFNPADNPEIPLDILDAARKVSHYFNSRGIVKWELMDICSRNHADQNRVYNNYFEFRKSLDAPIENKQELKQL